MVRLRAAIIAAAIAVLAISASVWASDDDVSAGLGGSPSPELNVVGGPVPVGFAAFGFPDSITDVWALGNYAYLGTFDQPICSKDTTGVHIIDISDPSDPQSVNFIPATPGARVNDVKVAHIDTPHFTGDILIHSQEPCGFGYLPRLNSGGIAPVPGKGGISIYDVTDPANARSLKRNYMNFGVHNTFIWQKGDNAYTILVDDNNVQDVHIIDITKPFSPKEVAVTGQLDWPPDIDNIGVGEVFLHDVWVQNDIAYLSYWDAGLVLLDVSDPSNPVFLGDSDYPDPDFLSGVSPEGNSHVAAPTADGQIVIMGDEDFTPGILTAFQFNGTDYPAVEGVFTMPIGLLPGGMFTGPVVWTGDVGCTPSEIPTAPVSGAVALIQRGVCFFQDKAEAAFAQGYAAFIVANHSAGGDTLVRMAPRDDGPYPPIPGVFVGFSTGEAMKTAPVGDPGGTLFMSGLFDGHGRMRVLDVSDPGNIVELGGFATENVFNPIPSADDRTMHNVVVDGSRAYMSWYTEGMRVVDFSGCSPGGGENSCSPTEVAHFVDTTAGSNFWGVYLHDHPNGNQYILGSDRNNGLWIFDVP